MIILSIETSCDDTGIAIIEKKNNKVKTLASVVSSQDEIHKKWGGVYPSEAKREHQKNLVPALKEVLIKASFLKKGSIIAPKNLKKVLSREEVLLENLQKFFKKNSMKKPDAIAVTVGPGLEPCLWAGINFARALSLYLNTPIIPVNHIKAHILFFLFDRKEIEFPAVALVVSGGHTELILANSLSSYTLIGKTRDDAAGECFDKAARILGLGYPGGPAIAQQAELWRSKSRNRKFEIKLPRPMMRSKNYDFSFSGLKTAVLYDFLSRDKKTQKNKNYISQMSFEVEQAITDVLLFKLKKATTEYGAKTVVLGGGVTANTTLQERVKETAKDFPKTVFLLPPFSLSTDNAEIIGAAASVERKRRTPNNLSANANMKIYDTIKRSANL